MTDAPFPDNFFLGRVESASCWLFGVGSRWWRLAVPPPYCRWPDARHDADVDWIFAFFGIIALLGSFSIHCAGPFSALGSSPSSPLRAVCSVAAPAGAAVLTFIVGSCSACKVHSNRNISRVRNASV
jgi:hypothetical protein